MGLGGLNYYGESFAGSNGLDEQEEGSWGGQKKPKRANRQREPPAPHCPQLY
jgi:hypothetical protein